MNEITRLLNLIDAGDARSADDLLALVYQELHRMAAHQMGREPSGQTLQTTALVHEAWVRLRPGAGPHWNSRGHFYKAAAEAMRRILVEHARQKRALKHGGGQTRVPLEDLDLATKADSETLLEVEEALERLAAADGVKAELVRLRFFGGLNHAEAAQALGLSEPTAKRYWAYARAWLYQEIERNRRA